MQCRGPKFVDALVVRRFPFSMGVIPCPLQVRYGDVIVIAARRGRSTDSRAAVPPRCASVPIAMDGG